MGHCKCCERFDESRRCGVCHMTGQEIATQRRLERLERQMSPNLAKYKPADRFYKPAGGI